MFWIQKIASSMLIACVALWVGTACVAADDHTLAGFSEARPLRIGVAAMISPKETISYYRRIILYVGEKLGVPVEMVQRKTYDEMDVLLKNRDVEAAFICSGPYVKDNKDFGAELLVAPQVDGKAFYHAYVLASSTSAAASFDDLQSKSFAFTDPSSNTGCLVAQYMLALRHLSPEQFFSDIVYSGNHGKSIEMVANNEVDGAIVDHLIWEYMNAENPEKTSRTKIIEKSPAYGMPPIVVHPFLNGQLKKQLQEVLLTMHEDPSGAALLQKVRIQKFIIAEDKNYDSIREMNVWIEKQKLLKL